MRKRTLWFMAVAVTLAVGTWPAGAAPDGSYAIRLARPQKVGDRYAVAIKGRQHKKERVTVGMRVAKESDTTIDVEAVAAAEVQAVDSKRQATRVAYTVERLARTVEGNTTEILGRGRVVIAEQQGGRTRFTVDGERPPKEVEEALGVVISAHEPEAATDDEIFGTRERKRVGDEWPINTEAAARDFTSKGIKLDPADVNGSTKLVAARTHEGLKVVELGGRLKLRNLTLPLPPGAQVDKSNLEAVFWGLFPQDPAVSRRVSESMLLKTELTVRMKKPDSGEDVLVEALVEQGHQAKYKPLGK